MEARMTPPLIDSPWWPYLALFLCAVLPTEIWRWLAVVFARRIDEGSESLEFIRMVAVALLAGVVAKLVITPSGALAGTPLWVRLAALALPLAVLALGRQRLLLATVAGEAVLIGGGFAFG
jgi:branched-subunit amino acid transport protein